MLKNGQRYKYFCKDINIFFIFSILFPIRIACNYMKFYRFFMGAQYAVSNRFSIKSLIKESMLVP